jgi:hypothetical protein
MKKAWPSRGSRKNFSARNLFSHPLPISSALSPFLVTSVSLTCSFPLPPSSARSLILSFQSFPAPLLLTSVVYSSFPIPTLLISFSESFFPILLPYFLTYEHRWASTSISMSAISDIRHRHLLFRYQRQICRTEKRHSDIGRVQISTSEFIPISVMNKDITPCSCGLEPAPVDIGERAL